MATATIQITYRHIIDANSASVFDKNVLHYSYEEFLLKSQAYNLEGKFKTFTELKANDGRENSLHYKCGFGVSGFIEQLNKKMPALTDCLGKQLPFASYSFELIESDTSDKAAHKVAIHFITGEFILHHSTGAFLVLSEKTSEPNDTGETSTLQMQPGLSITNYKEGNIS